MKILGNSIILGAIQLYSESYALADAIGFDPSVFHELHSGLLVHSTYISSILPSFLLFNDQENSVLTSENVFAAPALLNYSNKISQGSFGDAGFTVKTGLKGISPFNLNASEYPS